MFIKLSKAKLMWSFVASATNAAPVAELNPPGFDAAIVAPEAETLPGVEENEEGMSPTITIVPIHCSSFSPLTLLLFVF